MKRSLISCHLAITPNEIEAHTVFLIIFALCANRKVDKVSWYARGEASIFAIIYVTELPPSES